MQLNTPYARRSPRVRCRVPVQIRIERDAEHSGAPVFGHTIDVSRGGMRVDAPLQLPVGEPLVCSMTLDGKATSLPGHVAWSTEQGQAGGLGIAFSDINPRDARLLHDLVGATTPGAKPVELHFEGLNTPIRARAITRPRGIRLTASLPVLARNAGVVFRYGERPQPYTGHVANVVVREQDGARILEVDLEVLPEDRKRFRRHALYDCGPEGPATARLAPRLRKPTMPLWQGDPPPNGHADADTPNAAPEGAVAGDDPPAIEGRTGRRLRHVLSPIVAALASALLTLWATHEGSSAVGGADGPTPPVALRPENAPPASPAASPRAAAAPVGGPTATPPAATGPAATLPASVEEVGGHVGDTPAREPRVSTSHGAVRVWLPFEGSLEGLRVMRWRDPSAVLLSFPMARTPLDDGNYRIGTGGLGSLRVRRTAEGLQVRLLVSPEQGAPRLEQAAGELQLIFGAVP